MQYIFQCGCPVASDEARYPEHVDVIVPACRNVSSMLSPSGRFLYLHEKKVWRTSGYLLDLQTMERVKATDQSPSSFLTDNLWFFESGLEDDIMNRTTGKQYPIQTFRYWQENAYINGELNLELLVAALNQADQVFLTPNYGTVVVLMHNFFTNQGQGFTFDRSDFPKWDTNQIEQFLQENNVNYQTILASFPGEAVSPDGRFVARADGIYLVETGQEIVEGHSSRGLVHTIRGRDFSVRGWTYDGSGVIYSNFLNPCLIQLGYPFADGPPACFFEVPQPILKLKLPQEYLSPTSP